MKPGYRQYFPLFIISSIGLFLELAVVRWLSAEVRLFSYYKNLPLLAVFLGLAIGFMLTGKERDYRTTFAPTLVVFVVLTLLLGRIVSPRALAYPSRGDDFLWFTGDFSYWVSLILFLGTVLVFFLIIVFVFIPIGQATGNEMSRYKPVPAYIVNLLASLAGVWIFAIISFFQTIPVVWFGIALLGLCIYWGKQKKLSISMSLNFAVVLTGIGFLNGTTTWSPYHRLDAVELELPRQSDGKLVNVGYTLKVQQVFYQAAMDLSPDALSLLVNDLPELQNAADNYNLPYALAGDQPDVLVVGAGMGNDVAAGLRNNALRVDAVEIDPAIAAFGRRLHPEQPYDDPRVNLVIDDARSYLEKSDRKYDVVVFGFLDSQTLLSGLSSVRLDSFVYTLESFEQVQDHLKTGGIVVVSFAAQQPWIDERLAHMLETVFGEGNILIYHGGVGTNLVASATRLTTDDPRWVPWESDPNLKTSPLPLMTGLIFIYESGRFRVHTGRYYY